MYITYLTEIFNKLKLSLPELESHIVPIDTVIDKIENEYVIRPAFNFGVDNVFSNLRYLETDCIFTFQIFKAHDSSTDIVALATAIKKEIYKIASVRIDDALFVIKRVSLTKSQDSDFDEVSIQIIVNIL